MTGAERLLDDAVAVIAMAGRFPAAPSIEDFWTLLDTGREAIAPVPDEDYLAAGGTAEGLADPHLVRVACTLDGIDLFDAEFFGFAPAEAELLDPQQRIFLECAQHAFEHAGHVPADYPGEVGVYAGAAQSRYYLDHVYPRFARKAGSADSFAGAVANASSALVSRVSYLLNLTGPSVAVQTACSTSLVAIHNACQDLLDFRCDLALAGGASVNPSARLGYRHVPGGPFSPDGHCRPYSAAAAGMSPGDGVGVVLLKRLSEAVADGDHIRAVVRGSAVNNDGARKVGFTAPSVKGQRDVIVAAHAVAGVSPRQIGYVEGHGTATPVGDPIEVSALTKAFAFGTADTGFCVLGSVKSNVGHLDAAAGVAGFVKTVLALEHEAIPPTLHFSAPNELIDFDSSPFSVCGTRVPWLRTARPRLAGVSSFGIGGTNAHVILEEAPRPEARPASDGPAVVLLSADTAAALTDLRLGLADRLAGEPGIDVGDVAATLQVGRRERAHRHALVGDTADELVVSLRQASGYIAARGTATARDVVFLFPGAGSQYQRMGQQLYERHPVFRREMDRCARIVDREFGVRMLAAIYPAGTAVHRENVDLPSCAYPAIVSTEWALCRLLASWGVRPAAVGGHSLGEYTAACVAGVLDLEEALPLVVERERLIRQAGGLTLSVLLAADEVRELLVDGTSLAGVNAPGRCTVSGADEAILDLERVLASNGVEHHRLRTPGAVHSVVLDPVLDEFRDIVGRVALRAPRLPFVSNRTGRWLTPAEACDREHWVRHTRETVRFSAGLQTLTERAESPVLLEVGPSGGLTKLAEHTLGPETLALSTMRHAYAAQTDSRVLHGALAGLWAGGASVDWAAVRGNRFTRRVPLPGYPFQRRSYWIPAASAAPTALTTTGWRGAPAAREEHQPVDALVVALGRNGDPDLVPDGLTEGAGRVSCAGANEIREVRDLCTDLANVLPPDASIGVVDVSAVVSPDHVDPLDLARDTGDLLAAVADAFGDRLGRTSVVLATAGSVDLNGGVVPPRCRAVHGVLDRLADANPRLRVTLVDLDHRTDRAWPGERLRAELRTAGTDRVVALRGAYRWVAAAVAVTEPAGAGSGLPNTWLVPDAGREYVAATAARLRAAVPNARTIGVTDRDAIDSAVAAAGPGTGLLWVLDHTGPDDVERLEQLWHRRSSIPLDQVVIVDLGRAGQPAEQAVAAALAAALAEHAYAEGLPWRLIRWHGERARPTELLRDALRVTGCAVLTVNPPTDARPQSRPDGDDVAAKRRPARTRPSLRTPYVAPATDTERAVASVWRTALGIDDVGAKDNFFELGGESLLLMRIVAELRDRFVVTMSVRQLFVNDRLTISGIADMLEDKAS